MHNYCERRKIREQKIQIPLKDNGKKIGPDIKKKYWDENFQVKEERFSKEKWLNMNKPKSRHRCMAGQNPKGSKAKISLLTRNKRNKKNKKYTSWAYIFAWREKGHLYHDSLTHSLIFKSHHKCNMHNQFSCCFWHN